MLVGIKSSYAKNIADSIINIANNYSDTNRLNILKEAAYKYQNTPASLYLSLALEKEAKAQKERNYELYGLGLQAFYYLQVFDNSNLDIIISKLKTTSKKYNIYNDYIRALSYKVSLLLFQENYSSSLIANEVLLEISNKINDNDGKALAANNYYSIYVSNNDFSEAYKYIMEAKSLIDINKTNLGVYTSVYSNVLNYFNLIDDYESLYKYNSEYENIINTYLQDKPNEIIVFSPIQVKIEINYFYYFLDKYNKDNSNLNNIINAKKHLEKAKQINKNRSNQYSETLIDMSTLSYYSTLNLDNQIIILVDSIKNHIKEKASLYYPQIIKYKANALYNKGDYENAMKEYLNVYDIIDSTNIITSTNDAKLIVNNKHLSKIKEDNKKIKELLLIIITIVVSIILLIIIIYLTYSLIANKKAKHQKINLQKAYKRATNEKIEMELLRKEMSHAIRTPLNTIVGFADIIATEPEGQSKKEKDEIKDIISSSSSSLLGYIDDILYLSRIKSGKIQKDIKKIDISKLLEKYTNTTYHSSNTTIYSDPNIILKIISTSVDNNSSIIINRNKQKELEINIVNSPIIKDEYIKINTSIKISINSLLIEELGGYIELEKSKKNQNDNIKIIIPNV